MPYRRRAPTRRAPVRSRRSRLTRRKPAAKVRTRKHKAPVATGYSPNSGGVRSQMKMTQVSDTCLRITGRSYLGAVSNSDRGVNSIGLLADICPLLLGDRVAVLASTYDKYCYQSVTFTYIPQCATSQTGSVMLAFERDAEAPLADTQNTSFMQEVMSYEHAKLTPAWVSTSVTYKRDPHEKKTWFLGGDQAALSTRDSSQGTFMAYTSNAAVGNLGFVVMDYVLDLVAPNIMPNKTTPQLPSQWARVIPGAAAGGIASNPGSTIYTATANCSSGKITEIVVDTSVTNVYQQSNVGSTTPVAIQLNAGSRLYTVSFEGTANLNSPVSGLLVFDNLAAAIAASAGGMLETSTLSVSNLVNNFGTAFIGAGTTGQQLLTGAAWGRDLQRRITSTA